jgi:multidrug efflux system membrane fusion protein
MILPRFPESAASSSKSQSGRALGLGLWLTGALILPIVLAGCGPKTASEGGAPAASAKKGGGGGAVPVVVEKVKSKSMPLAIDAIGAVESLHSISVRSLVTGLLVKVNFKEGQEVKQGDLLFEIDPRPFQIALSLAEADHEKTRIQLETAEKQLERYKALIGQGMVSQDQFSAIQNTAGSLKAQLQANEATIANAKLQLEYCEIHAPSDGRTGSLGAHEGDLVRASDANVMLVSITQLAPIYVSFAVPQKNLADLQRYMSEGKVMVSATAGTEPEKGELTFLDSAIDASTGTIRLKATFPNSKRVLWPGQFVNVQATLAMQPDQLVVPSTALQTGQKGLQVFVVNKDNIAQIRNVTVGRTVGMESVITKGLAVDETVVIDGQIRLRPDTLVEIKAPVVDVPSVRGGSPDDAKAGEAKKSGKKKKDKESN